MKKIVTAEDMVGDVLHREPETIRVFARHGMACVGCAVAPYHSIAETTAEYGLCLDTFLRELVDSAHANQGARPKRRCRSSTGISSGG